MSGHSSQTNPLDDKRLAAAGIKLPFVSVVVTCYNYENYIVACLQSVARQSYPHFECVVVDDHSTDDSVRLIEEFIGSVKSAVKFFLVRHSSNGGQMAAFRTGLQHAQGVFVVFVDADDLLLEDFLVSHVRAHISARLPVAFTSSNQFQINEDDQMTAGNHADLQTNGKFRYVAPKSLQEPYWIWATTSSMMFRRAILQAILPDDCEPFRVCADNYICHFANLVGGSMLIPTVHGCYRRHGRNCFSNNPIVGGCLPTGDMRRHPRHKVVRTGIVSHLQKNRERFVGMLSEPRFTSTILLASTPLEIWQNRKYRPELFPGKGNLFFFSLSAYAVLLRMKLIIAKMLRMAGEQLFSV